MPTVYPFRFSNLTRLGCGLVGSKLGLLPTPAHKLFRDEAVGPLLGGLPVEFPGVALAKLTHHQLQQPSPVQACTSAAGRLPLYAKGLMEPLSGLMAVPRRSPSVGPPPFAPAVQRWAE